MIVSLLALLGGSAFAGDPAPAPAAAPTPPAAAPDCKTLTGDAKVKCDNAVALKAAQDGLAALGDCTKLTGDAKTTCDAKKVELATKIAQLQLALAPPTDTKGGKAVRSNTGRMESEGGDE
jgi:hypothetical protein